MKDNLKADLHIWQDLARDYSLIRLRGKDPSKAEGTGWERFCREKRSFDEIPFRPGENAGIACGPASGVLVLDVDEPTKLQEWLDEHGYFLPETRIHLTGSGKPHHLFQYPKDGKKYGCRSFKYSDPESLDEKAKPKQRTIFDIKGDGGQVVAPGSIHPDTGQPYTVGNDLPITPAPKWLLDLALKEEPKYEERTTHPQTAGDDELFHWDGEIDSLPIKPETKNLILQGVPRGQRSEAQMTVLKALVWANSSDAEMFDIFRTYPIGEKWRKDWNGNDGALQKEIDKARAQMEGQERAKKPIQKKKLKFARNEAKSAEKLRFFELSDIGNGERFVHQHQENVRYCHPWGSWLVWNGKQWKLDNDGKVKELAKETARSIAADASFAKDDETFKAVLKWAKRSTAQQSIRAMLWMADSEPGIPVQPEDLDKNHWLFNCQNGTIDLKTGKLLPHVKAHLITKISPAVYDPNAECPIWDRFLSRIMDGNQELISFLQRAIGYCLTGDDGEQCLFTLHGTGANGKSVFLDTIKAMIGDYAKQAEFQTFLVQKNETVRNDIADLRGARFVAAIEAEAGQRLAESVVKSMTGGDTLKARFLFKEYFEFQPTFKIFLAANHKPTIRGTDHAIWRRIRLIPFTVTIPEHERDGSLRSKLLSELPGILAWAVRGCLDWQKNGLWLPQEVRTATEVYREEMDVLSGFLSEYCVMEPTAKTPTKDLYALYETWCGENGETKLSQQAFGRRLSERGLKSERTTSSRYWSGIGIQDINQSMTDMTDMTLHDAFPRNTSSRENSFQTYQKKASESVIKEKASCPKHIKCVDCFFCSSGQCVHEKWQLAPKHGLYVLHECDGYLGKGLQ